MIQDEISNTPIEHPNFPKGLRLRKDHPIQNVIGNISKKVTTRQSLNKVCNFMAFVSQIEPTGINKVIIDDHWSLSIQEKLN